MILNSNSYTVDYRNIEKLPDSCFCFAFPSVLDGNLAHKMDIAIMSKYVKYSLFRSFRSSVAYL